MSKTLEIAREALQQMSPETRLRPEDAAVIARHKEILLSWIPELVQGFVAGMEPALLTTPALEARRLLAEITRG